MLATLVRQPWHLYATIGVMAGGGSVCLGYIGHSLFLPYWFMRRRGFALLVLVILLPLNFLLRRRPQGMGLEPHGDRAATTSAPGRRAPNVVDPEWAAIDWTLARAARSGPRHNNDRGRSPWHHP